MQYGHNKPGLETLSGTHEVNSNIQGNCGC